MKFALHCASSSTSYEIREFKSIDELISFKKESIYDIIIEDNEFYLANKESEKIKDYTRKRGERLHIIEEVYELPYSILVYDDYIE